MSIIGGLLLLSNIMFLYFKSNTKKRKAVIAQPIFSLWSGYCIIHERHVFVCLMPTPKRLGAKFKLQEALQHLIKITL